MIHKGIFLYIFLVLSLCSIGQTNHYWTEQFGTRASFLGGAAIAGLKDNATVYYNPAAMSEVVDPSLSVNADAYRIRMSNVENAIGDGLDMKNVRFVSIPNLIAGILPLDTAKNKFSLGYAIIAKTVYNNKMDYLFNSQVNLLPQTNAPENYIATYKLQHQVNAVSAGFAGSYKINNHWRVGLSHFFEFEDFNYSQNVSVRALPEDYNPAYSLSMQSNIDFKYWYVIGTFNIGVQYLSEKLKLGLTWKPPSYNIVGKANAFREYQVNNLPIIASDSSFSIIDKGDNMAVKYKNNGSVAWGVQWNVSEKVKLYFSQELFFGHKTYQVYQVKSNDVDRYPTSLTNAEIESAIGTTHFLAYEKSLKTILNSGFGIEIKATDRLDLLLGMRTDFDAGRQQTYNYESIQLAVGKINMMHFSFGTSYKNYNNKRYDIGIEVGTALPNTQTSWANFSSPTIVSHLAGANTENMKYKQFMIKLLIGIALDFKK